MYGLALTHLDSKNARVREGAALLLDNKAGLVFLAERANPARDSIAFKLLVEGAKDKKYGKAVIDALRSGANDPRRPGIAQVLKAMPGPG